MKKTVRRILLAGVGAVVLATTSAFAYVNLTYRRDHSATPLPNVKASQDPAVLAQGAYVVNAGNSDGGVRNYARGYYYEARAKGLLADVGLD